MLLRCVFFNTTLSHTISHHLSHTALSHTQLCHTLSFTHNFVKHHLSDVTNHLSYTTLSHTIFHTPSLTHHLFQTPSFTHHLSHTSFTHNFVTRTCSQQPSFCVAGVALMALGWLWWRALFQFAT